MKSKSCVFRGVSGKLTGEHVLGDWLTRIGLGADPVLHGSGPIAHSGQREHADRTNVTAG